MTGFLIYVATLYILQSNKPCDHVATCITHTKGQRETKGKTTFNYRVSAHDFWSISKFIFLTITTPSRTIPRSRLTNHTKRRTIKTQLPLQKMNTRQTAVVSTSPNYRRSQSSLHHPSHAKRPRLHRLRPGQAPPASAPTRPPGRRRCARHQRQSPPQDEEHGR